MDNYDCDGQVWHTIKILNLTITEQQKAIEKLHNEVNALSKHLSVTFVNVPATSATVKCVHDNEGSCYSKSYVLI
jgi:hypothetical protein